MGHHHHTWRSTGCLTLSLPRAGWVERLVAWTCPGCGTQVVMVAEMRLGVPLGTPEQWEAQQAREQRQQTPEAQAARRGQRRRVTDGYEFLHQGNY